MAAITKLTREEYLACFTPGMHSLKEDQGTTIDLKTYFLSIVEEEKLAVDFSSVDVPHVFRDTNKEYEHILVSYGPPNNFVVILLYKRKVHGFYLLDLKDEYGLTRTDS
ncbi:MAG: hypothetical protein AAFY71_06340 [Bacteroidota bacterium]